MQSQPSYFNAALQPCKLGKARMPLSEKKKKRQSRGHLFPSFHPVKVITDKHRWRGHRRILAIHQKQNMDTNRTWIPVRELIAVVQRLLPLRHSPAGADFPGFLELIYWSPDTEASGPKMSCARKVSIKTQAIGRCQGRSDGITTLVFKNRAFFSGLGGNELR